jgi:hypothetical protein
MNRFLSRILAIGIGLTPIVAPGCQGNRPPAPPPDNSGDPAQQPIPRADEALAYLEAALKDKTRVIEVFVDQGDDGILDGTGRSSFGKSLPKWWQGVQASSREPKPGDVPFRVTPDMGVRIYAPGSAALLAKSARMGQPDVQIKMYVSYRFSRVLINDPAAPRFGNALYIIPSTGPSEWADRLLSGKL